jgi:hypothetical protein
LKEEEQRKEMERIRQEELTKQGKLEEQETEIKRQEDKLKEFLSDKTFDVNENNIHTNTDNTMNGNVRQKSPRKLAQRSKEGTTRASITNSVDFGNDLQKGYVHVIFI